MIQELATLPQDVGPKDRVVRLKPFQDKFIFSEARYPCLTSAWGTGKTMSLIEKIRIAAEKYPNNLIMFLRKEFVDLRDSTIKDWNENTGVTVGSSRDAHFPNNSIVMFRHGSELLGNNLNNMNLGAFAIEQGEELESDEVFFKLQGRLRRKGVAHFGAVIANTNGHNWIYKLWKSRKDSDYPLFEANSFDNADILPEKTVEDWKKLEHMKPKTFRRFVMNSWDDTDAIDLVIDPEWIKNSVNKNVWIQHPIKKVISIDVARYGDDKTVFYALESGQDDAYRTLAKETHEKKSTMEIVGRAVLFGQKLGIKAFAVDEIGVGSGVVDRLKELEYQVIPVNSSERSSDPDKYYNTRAEIYGKGAILFQNSKVSTLIDDEQLHEELSWAKYKVIKSNGLIQIEAKEDIKARYAKSPDNADAFLNGLWALRRVREEKNPLTTSERNTTGWSKGGYVPAWAKGQQPREVMR